MTNDDVVAFLDTPEAINDFFWVGGAWPIEFLPADGAITYLCRNMSTAVQLAAALQRGDTDVVENLGNTGAAIMAARE